MPCFSVLVPVESRRQRYDVAIAPVAVPLNRPARTQRSLSPTGPTAHRATRAAATLGGKAGAKRSRLDRNRGLVRRVHNYTRAYVPGDAMLGTILLIILILLLVGALPTWPYSSGWGYYPSGGFGLLLIIIIVLLVAGRI
jgi:Protein of unknown function (DUF3309)